VPAFGAQRLDVGAGGFADPQRVQGQQRDQGVLGGRAKAGGDEQGPDLVAPLPLRLKRRLILSGGSLDRELRRLTPIIET
jgi:hypothetical protein